MKAHLSIILSVIVCFLSACAYNAAIPPDTKKVDNKTTLNMPLDDAWKKAIQVIASGGYNIKSSNKQDGIITTEKKLIRLDDTQADCGNIWGLPYTKDTRTTTHAALTLVLSAQGERTAATANAQIDGLFNATADSGSKTLSCYSLGYLEKDLLDKMTH